MCNKDFVSHKKKSAKNCHSFPNSQNSHPLEKMEEIEGLGFFLQTNSLFFFLKDPFKY